MKKNNFFIAALMCMILLTACKTGTDNEITAGISDGDPSASALTETDIVSKTEASPTGFSTEDSYVSEPVTFVWEEVGFGGDFVVTLEPFNMFQMCEGPLSSTIYRGYFDVDGDIVTLSCRSASSRTAPCSAQRFIMISVNIGSRSRSAMTAEKRTRRRRSNRSSRYRI